MRTIIDYHEQAKAEVERLGYSIISTRLSKVDDNLAVVLAKSDGMKEEYVVWSYNISENGLFGGQYYTYQFYDIVLADKNECFQNAIEYFYAKN